MVSSAASFGQEVGFRPTADNHPPILPSDLTWRPTADPSAARGPRLYTFRTPAGAFSDILVRTDATAEANTDPSLRAVKTDDAPELPVNVVLSADNPYFDFRRPGDLGGVGYQRLYTEVRLLSSETTCLALNCHAATPAGLECDGLADGPTQFSPALTLSQDLGDGLAVQGFVGRTMRANLPALGTGPRNMEYGVVVQHPVPGLDGDTETKPRVFLFVETLGRYRFEEGSNSPQPTSRWDLLPGVHFRGGDNWWVSGGVMLPLGPARPESGLWQVTCALQF